MSASSADFSTTSSYFVAEPEREESLRAVREVAARYGERFVLPRLTYVFAFARIN